MDLWEYTKMAVPVMITSHIIGALLFGIGSFAVDAIKNRRPRGR